MDLAHALTVVLRLDHHQHLGLSTLFGLSMVLFRLLFETAEIATFTPQEKIRLENDMRTERDLRNQIAYAREEGIEVGFEKGIEKGIETERSRMAAELREQGVSEDVIARVTRGAK